MRDFARPIRLPKRNKTSKIRPASGLTSVYINGPQNARTSEGEKWKNAPKRLLDQVREAIRFKHYSIRTEEAYVS